MNRRFIHNDTIGYNIELADEGYETEVVDAKSYDKLERQLAKVMAQLDKIATHIHYPDCWDDVAYPTLADAVCEITRCDPEQCSKGGGNDKL